MDDEIESLLVDVRANTQGFAQDIEAMRSTLDGTLVGGFERAGSVLETGLASAIRRGGLGFDDLKRVALRTMDEIAGQAVQSGLGSILGTGSGGGGGLAGSLVGALFGLPGRATGGPVSPGSAYVVGERGPEIFVPTSAGRVEAQPASGARDVRVAIRLATPRGSDTPTALRRSTRQLASAVRRAVEG
ncbi:tail tape measure protein [Altererythrobacter fulvus]|uniref:tail tape measure protein n=1 Tax=Caenibius fulvus TaxID=2126012 RepID=UPI00301A2D23